MRTSDWRHYFNAAQRDLEGVHAAWLAKDWAELAIHGVSCLHALTRSPPSNPDVQSLIDDMLSTLSENFGVGLAAPQVYESCRIFIASSRPIPFYDNAPTIEPLVMINPVITWTHNDLETNWEACLSIRELRGQVPPHTSLRVKFITPGGLEAEGEFSGLMSRVIQHENDHLDGVLYIDRLQSKTDLISETEYRKLLSK